MIELTEQQRQELRGPGPLARGPQTNETYVLVRKEAYGTARPQCASNLIGVTRLAFPEQLIEITFKAMLSGAEAKPR